MNTLTNAYLTKFSSGIITALFLFSAILFIVPMASPVHAGNLSLPTFTVTPNVLFGTAVTGLTIAVANPSGNSYAINAFTISGPAGWTLSGTPAAPTFTCSLLSSSTQCVSGNLAPGGTVGVTGLSLAGPTVTSYPATATFTTTVQDASATAYYAGPTFKEYEIQAGPTVSWSPASVTSFIAGSAALSFTVSLGGGAAGDSGVPLAFTATAGSLSTASASTSSSGSVVLTYTPSNLAGTATLTAAIGTTTTTGTATVTTIAAAPARVTFYLGSLATVFPSTHYVTTSGVPASAGSTCTAGIPCATIASAGVLYAVTDQFTNPVSFASIFFTPTQGVTLTAISGGGFFDTAGVPATVSCLGAACTAAPWTLTGPSGTLPFSYFQSGTFSTIGILTATITGTYPGSSGTAFSKSGASGSSSTSTFATTATTPALPGSPTTITAGGSVVVKSSTSTAQGGVPVTFYLNAASTPVNKDGKFVASALKSVVVSTAANGTASAAFSVDTGATATQSFIAKYARPQDSGTQATANSTASATVTTVAGAVSTFTATACFVVTNPCPTTPVNQFTSFAASTAGTALYMNVAIADAYGNTVIVAPGSTVQIALTVSGGALSATSVYITNPNSNTATSFGPVVWTTPTTLGAATFTATGVLSGNTKSTTKTVTIVSPLPTLNVNSPKPLGGYIYAKTSPVVFGGNASASKGYPTSTTIAANGVKYKLGSGASGSVTVAASNYVAWSAAITVPSGLSTITFNATDSKSNTVTSPTFTLLVASTPPTIAFTTTSGSTLTAGSPIAATITDPFGILNATSVKATYNGTAVATTGITVTGTNTPGSSVTYTVSISGIPSGKWSVILAASDLAGNAAAAVTGTFTVVVLQNNSFTVSGTPSQTTVGSFKAVAIAYLNNLPTQQSVVILGVAHNAAGQTVSIATSSINPSAGATATGNLVFAGLASGTYSVTIFVVQGTTVLSATTTFSLTV